jgi:hypothetical protein
MNYETYENYDKNEIISNIVKNIKHDPISKLESYDAILIETNRLLNREQTLFIINSIVTIGLVITLFQVI